jgi:hypothetical protein
VSALTDLSYNTRYFITISHPKLVQEGGFHGFHHRVTEVQSKKCHHGDC